MSAFREQPDASKDSERGRGEAADLLRSAEDGGHTHGASYLCAPQRPNSFAFACSFHGARGGRVLAVLVGELRRLARSCDSRVPADADTLPSFTRLDSRGWPSLGCNWGYFDRPLQLAAGGENVAASRAPDEGRNSCFYQDALELKHPLLIWRSVGQLRPGIQRDQIDFCSYAAHQLHHFARLLGSIVHVRQKHIFKG